MISPDTVTKAAARLDQAIAAGQMPAAADGLATRISKRLSNPVRIALMGLQGAGKSQLLNFLTGADVIPEYIKLPSTLLAWGDAKKAQCTLPNGKIKSLDTIDFMEILRLKPVFIRLEMPLPPLKKISLLEVVTGTSQAEQQRALAWAARSTDVALWCTQEFTQTENELWSAMPQPLQDHSFLVMTKSDLLMSPEAVDKQISGLTALAAENFQRILPVQTLEAIAARGDDGEIDKTRLAESGGQDLIRAVLQAVEQGIQASLDGAEILFNRYKIPEPDMAAQTAPSTEAAPPSSAMETEKFLPVNANFNSEVVSYLEDRVIKLQSQLSGTDVPDAETVMAQCYEDVEWLMEQLSINSEADPELLSTLDACQDAADMMLLLQLENHESAVEDAVVLLLQIKRDFESKLAA